MYSKKQTWVPANQHICKSGLISIFIQSICVRQLLPYAAQPLWETIRTILAFYDIRNEIIPLLRFILKVSRDGIYLLKVSNRNTRRWWPRYGVFIFNFEHISLLALLFLLLTLSRQMQAGKVPSYKMFALKVQYSTTLREKWPNTEFFWSVFSCIRTKHGDLLGKSPY